MRFLLAALVLAALLPAACTAASGQDAGAGPAAAPVPDTLRYVGRVVDEDGRPVAGARVWADNGGSYQTLHVWDERPWRMWVPDPAVVADVGPWTEGPSEPTGSDGRFTVPDVRPPVGKGWVVAVHEGYATALLDATSPDVHGDTVDVGDVRLERGRSVRVSATLPDGAAAAGAWVVARPANRGDRWKRVGSETLPGEVRAARADDAGVAVVRGLRAAAYRVAAFTDTALPTEATVDLSGPDADAQSVTLSLAPGATLRIEVVRRGEETPVEGARVQVDVPEAGNSWPGPAPLAVRRTPADGVLSIEGLEPRDEYRVTVVPPDWADDRVHSPGAFCLQAVATPGATVRVALDPTLSLTIPVRIARSARWSAEVPADGVRAIARAVWDRYDRTGGFPVDVSATGGADGRVTLQGLRPGPWTIDVWAPGAHPTRIGPIDVTPPDRTLDTVTLEAAAATAQGRVFDHRTGAPVAGARVASYEWIERFLNGQRSETASSPDGRFRLAWILGTGTPLRVEVSAEGYVGEVREWTKDARTPDLGDIVLVPAATVTGRLVSPDGAPLPLHEVLLLPADARGRGKGVGWYATTDADGRFSIGGLRPGSYRVAETRREVIDVAEGETVRLGDVRP